MSFSDQKQDLLVWEDTGETITDIVNNHQLPILVKVSEGYYGETDAESFSSGDLIKLDLVKTLIKVLASVGESENIPKTRRASIDVNNLYWRNELLIPLGYKGKLQVMGNDHVATTFDTVQDLIEQFPRFVRVESAINVKAASGKFIVPALSELELDRVIPSQGLVCRYGNKECLIDIRENGKFVSIPDSTLYTLREVIDKLPLPQYVKFVDKEFEQVMTESLDEALENIQNFSGVLKLQEVLTQRVVVGHHKPVEEISERTSFCERSLVLLPLDNPIVDEIEVLTPSKKDTEEYEILLTKNFSNKNVNMGQFDDGGLYLEMRSTTPKIQRFSNKIDSTPPPIPPRPTRQDQQTDKGTDIHEYDKVTTRQEESANVPKEEYADFVVPDEASRDNDHDYIYPEAPKKSIKLNKKPPNPNINRPLPLTPHQVAQENIPIGKVLPHCSNSKQRTSQVQFTSLSVNELADIFEKCELRDLAELCRSEILDGAFFDGLSDEDLMKNPFNLSSINLIKYKRIKSGWIPKQ